MAILNIVDNKVNLMKFGVKFLTRQIDEFFIGTF